MEIWDLYTADRKSTGLTMVRGDKNPEGLYNLSVTVWIKNSKGQYLISQRSEIKKTYPHKWEPVGGGVMAGESSLEGAVREVYEEVGIRVNPENLQLIFTDIGYSWNGKQTSEINDVYLYKIGEYDASFAVSEEVSESRWLYPAEIKDMFDSGEFIELYKYFFEKIHKEE